MPPDTNWRAVGMTIDPRNNNVYIVAIDNANDIWVLRSDGATILNQTLNTWALLTPGDHP